MAVLYAAKKYNIPDLVDASLQVPVSSLRNVFLAYALAKLYEMEGFANDCLAYIDKNADTLLKSEEFLQIDQKLLCEIFGPLRWADEKCHENGIECSAENRRQMLGPALFKIRFPLFSKEEFSQKIDKNWSCECSAATFRIVLKKFDMENSTGKLLGKIFNHTESHAGFPGSISFAELLYPGNGFYNQNDDNVTLTVDFILKNAQDDQFASRKSDTVHIKGMPWKIVAQINESADGEKCLGFYLLCAVPKGTPNWSRKCSASFRIVPRDPREAFDDRIFNNESPIHGFYNFVTFSYLEWVGTSSGWYNKKEDKVTLAIDIYLDDEKRERDSNSIFD
ncbi:hypothetical protein niasHT_006328 [Heterodera trifolii]|uniref:BACK domain-containing protein n=1 Tax=Heterodera trifolii TaxID=157864 RepID=A0ABD2M4L3_9BILA